MTVGQLLASCSSAELTEWMAFLQVEEEDAEAERLRKGQRPADN